MVLTLTLAPQEWEGTYTYTYSRVEGYSVSRCKIPLTFEDCV